MSACCDPDVLSEVVSDGLLAVQSQLLIDILPPMIDAPEIEWDMLAQMTNHDLKFGVAIEYSFAGHAEDM